MDLCQADVLAKKVALDLLNYSPGGITVQKHLLTMLVGIGIGMSSAQAAEVIVTVAPPAAIVETRPVAPHGHYVWVGGYHRWMAGHMYGYRVGGTCHHMAIRFG